MPKPTPGKNRWELHVASWSDCHRCHLSETRSKIVLSRGKLPCDILFVGEAPGHGEDTVGRPFVGPAGHKLDDIVTEALKSVGNPPLRLLFANLLACIPIGDDGRKVESPPEECVRACAPRLDDLIDIAKPKLIVCVGKEAAEWFDGKYGAGGPTPPLGVPRLHIVHPAALLRMQYDMEIVMTRRAVAAVATAIQEMGGG